MTTTLLGISQDPSERKTYKLFFRDDFEKLDASTVPKAIGTTASTAEVTFNYGTQGTVTPFEGRSMLKIADADAKTEYVKYQFGQLAGKVAINVKVWYDGNTDIFGALLDWYNKVSHYRLGIRYSLADTRWEYMDDTAGGATYAAITGATETIATGTWYEFTLVVDPENGKYVKLITMNGEYDLTALSPFYEADAATLGSTLVTVGGTVDDNADPIYLDDLRIYTNAQE